MRSRFLSTILLAFPLLLVSTACQPEAEEGEVGMEAEEEALPEPVQEHLMVVDTVPDAVWSYLQEQNYSESWAFWPEKEPYYQGTQPHGALLSTYLNQQAMEGLEAMRDRGEPDLPFGSIIVKENYMPDSTLAAVTVMYKVEMYDPEHNDWWWMKRLADGTVEASGRVESCIQCHQQAQDFDYLMTAMSQSQGMAP